MISAEVADDSEALSSLRLPFPGIGSVENLFQVEREIHGHVRVGTK